MSTVIKADGSQGRLSGSPLTAFNLEDVETRANRYLEQARAQAAQIIGQVKKQAESIRSQAKIDGRQEAVEEAQRHATQQAQQQLDSLLPALHRRSRASSSCAEYLQHWQQQIVHLAVAIAQRVVRTQLPRMPELTMSLVRESLELAAGGADLRLHLNPHDEQALRDRMGQFLANLGNIGPADIVADPAVSRGGCLVKTQYGEIDQTIEAQLRRIEEELTCDGRSV